MLRCLIIDDDELARILLKTYIAKIDFIEIIGAFENSLDALTIIENENIDVVFLDIEMPEIKGTDFAKLINSHTNIVFTTARSEYALEGFELNALDYLLKPITFERFLSSATKLKDNLQPKIITDQSITVKSGYDLHKLKYSEILYIQSDGEYVYFYTNDKKIMSYQSLKSLEKKLPKSTFMRVHRSFIINKNHVTGLKGKDLLLSEIKIPVSATYFETVKNELF